jgi:hypothetical protein
MPAAHIYQIFYMQQAELDPGFLPLDNSANERPDWYEYWPMRGFLLKQPLDENAYYGFLSPKFKAKTNLDAADVHAFIASSDPAADVMLFSPSIHNSAFYWNVFEHGESEHPGLLAVAEEFFARIGHAGTLAALVSDSRNTVYSNYFIARPRFWRAWLAVNEQLFAMAESPHDPLGERLRSLTRYRGASSTSMKIFIMERIASWLLCTDASFASQARDPFAARSRIYKLPLAITCDALKMAWVRERRGQYRDAFEMLRAWRRLWTFQIRLGAATGRGGAGAYLAQLKSYWSRKA